MAKFKILSPICTHFPFQSQDCCQTKTNFHVLKITLQHPAVALSSHYVANVTTIVILKLQFVPYAKSNPMRLHPIVHFPFTKTKQKTYSAASKKSGYCFKNRAGVMIFALLKLTEISGIGNLPYTSVVMKKDPKKMMKKT